MSCKVLASGWIKTESVFFSDKYEELANIIDLNPDEEWELRDYWFQLSDIVGFNRSSQDEFTTITHSCGERYTVNIPFEKFEELVR